MTFTKYTDLNNLLIIIDACNIDAKIVFAHYLSEDFFDSSNPQYPRRHALKKYIDDDFNFYMTQANKQDLINVMADIFTDGDLYHYTFYSGTTKIGEGFDYCIFNKLNPAFFELTQKHLDALDDVEIHYLEEFT